MADSSPRHAKMRRPPVYQTESFGGTLRQSERLDREQETQCKIVSSKGLESLEKTITTQPVRREKRD